MRASTAAALIAATIAAPTAGGAGVKARGPSADPYMPIQACAEKLAPPIDALLKPVLLALVTERRAMRLHDPRYARQLQALLRSQHPRALEAQVAALAYYLGDQEGEQVLTHVLAQGKAADELVGKYKACRPPTSFEAKLGNVETSSTKYTLYEEERRSQTAAAARRPAR
jgi:hypothetical protein